MSTTRRHRVFAIVLAAVVVMLSASGCAAVARTLTVIEALDTVRQFVGNPTLETVSSGSSELQGTVSGTGGAGLRLNARPGSGRIGLLREGTIVVVLCQTDGPAVRSTIAWSKVRGPGDRVGYVSDAYLVIDPTADPPAVC